MEDGLTALGTMELGTTVYSLVEPGYSEIGTTDILILIVAYHIG